MSPDESPAMRSHDSHVQRHEQSCAPLGPVVRWFVPRLEVHGHSEAGPAHGAGAVGVVVTWGCVYT